MFQEGMQRTHVTDLLPLPHAVYMWDAGVYVCVYKCTHTYIYIYTCIYYIYIYINTTPPPPPKLKCSRARMWLAACKHGIPGRKAPFCKNLQMRMDWILTWDSWPNLLDWQTVIQVLARDQWNATHRHMSAKPPPPPLFAPCSPDSGTFFFVNGIVVLSISLSYCPSSSYECGS